MKFDFYKRYKQENSASKNDIDSFIKKTYFDKYKENY